MDVRREPLVLVVALVGTALSACSGSSEDIPAPVPIPTPIQQHSLTVSLSGAGTINRSPVGSQCGGSSGDCQMYDADTQVTLTAAAEPGNAFAGWSGDCSGSSLSLNVIVDTDIRCTAGFSATSSGPICGNNLLEPPEQCDDGNARSGDGCSSACQVEATTTSIFDPAHPLHQYLTATGSIPQNDPDGGSFRIKCEFAHLNYDDSIVYPAEPDRSHLHMYFGNTLTDFSSTVDSLLNTGESTCHGGPINRSAYWVPSVMAPNYDSSGQAIIDLDGFLSTTVVLPVGGVAATDVYYKAAVTDLASINPMPPGLRMITGNARSSGPQPREVVRWSCESDPIQSHEDFSQFIPACQIGDNVRLTIFFPSCWDGVNLDSPDHASHMAQPQAFGWPQSTALTCPTTHPVPVPEVSYNLAYAVTSANAGPDGTSGGWLLSSDMYDISIHPGGYSAHGDWFMAWNNEAMQVLTQNCLHRGLHCANGELGQGWALIGHESTGTQFVPPVIARGMGPGMLP